MQGGGLVASRTQIVCLCEGGKGESIDEVFINRLMKSLQPSWLRPWGSNVIRLVPCGNRQDVIQKVPAELVNCLRAGGHTTLMVWADCDHDCADPDALRALFWSEAQQKGITAEQFDRVVFALAKDRMENWIEFLATGHTDETKEGPRLKSNREAAEAAKKLAAMCREQVSVENSPASLRWSCRNWRAVVDAMKAS